jgi:hypothetical protein
MAQVTPLPLAAETTGVPNRPGGTGSPVEVTVPVLVMYRGLSAVPRTTGPVVLLLIVFDIGLCSIVGRRPSWSHLI